MRERILVVEDEAIVAKNIQNRLKKLGYFVANPVSTGQEAIKRVSSSHPNLVLMDIVLEGNMDGVDAARKIRARYDIPIVYLTAHADDKFIQRAKFTEPFGYVLKPFEIKELHSAIQVALYKHAMERKLKEKKKNLANTLKNIGYAVITTDNKGFITYMNPPAETLSGFEENEALGKNLNEVLTFYYAENEYDSLSFVKKVIKEGSTFGFKCYVDFARTGNIAQSFLVNFVPSRDENGRVNGSVLVFRAEKDERRAKLDFSSVEAPKSETKAISLVVLSSSNIVMDGISKILESEKDIDLIGVSSSKRVVLQFIERTKPDVLLIDTMSVARLEIRETLYSTKKSYPQTKLLLLLHAIDDRITIDALSLGARGFLVDKTKPEKLVQAIRFVNKGEIWGDLKVIKKILARLALSRKGTPKLLNTSLTKREEEIARLVAEGYSNKGISTKLFISESTVKKHLYAIFKKLGIKNRLQIALELNNYP